VKPIILPLAMLVTASIAGAHTVTITDVVWLQGRWEQRDGDRLVEERWMPPRAGVLTERDGRLAYEAHPSGQAAATFMSKPISGREVVFEDLMHDFPQRVGYKSSGPGQLLAWVEGMSGGRTRRIEFAYRQVNCVAP
jgi:hypothetical protein